VRDALLYWLADQYRNNVQWPNVSQFGASAFAMWYGEPFPKPEVDRASIWLRDSGLVDGMGSANADGLLRAKIIEKGLAVVENDRSVNDPEPRAGGAGINLTINQSGDYAVAQAAGHGSVQSFTQTTIEDHQEQIVGFANALEELVRAKDLTGASALPTQIRDAAESRDHASVARILTGTREYLEQHASTGLGALVLVELGNLMHTIGLS
jgi:hypothetical protein